MVTLRELVGDDHDADTLFQAALGKARHRLVIKRAKLDEFICNHKPSFSQIGKSSFHLTNFIS